MASRGVPSSYKEIEQYVPNEKDLMRLECLVRKNPDRKITEIIDHSTEYDVVYMREKWMKRSVPVTYKIIITCLSVNVVVIVICCFLFFIRLIRK